MTPTTGPPQSSPGSPRPGPPPQPPGTELAQLRDRAVTLAREIKDSKRDHAAQITELEDQVKTYAGQIQVLAVANQELKEENHRLRNQIEHAAPGVSQLRQHPRTGDE